MKRLTTYALAVVILSACAAPAALDVNDVPQFVLRARVVSDGGAAPVDRRYTFSATGIKDKGVCTGTNWTDDLRFDLGSAVDCLKGYPNMYLKRYPVVVKLSVRPASESISIEAQLRWRVAEKPTPGAGDEADVLQEMGLESTPADAVLKGDLFGPTLGFLMWREDGRPRVATMAEYNRRFWKELEGVTVSEAQRPKLFPIVDRFIGGDDDKMAWHEGIQSLSHAGFSALMLPPTAKHRAILQDMGLKRTAWAVYNPPGYAYDYSEDITEESIQQWADGLAAPYLDAGYAPRDIAMYTISDEPGWYFPKMFKIVAESSEGIERFRAYLADQGLRPADVGHKDWSTVVPIGRSSAGPVTANRLFYWSTRFVAWDSARHFAACTRALESAFYPGIPLPVNWNFFSGRYYFPGPFAHNSDKESPDCGMGSHDWFEFAKIRGTTCLWTEDWFGDGRAWQWSFYCSKMNSAARRAGIVFGGYVIPRTCGAREDGILQKILTVIGSGGKALKYFVFGPEYSFPGNCYSFKSELLPKMAEAHMMIGAAEDLLWPGLRPMAQVAILQPRSAFPWDAIDQTMPTEIVDATNNALERRTVDYAAEVFGLYVALQHANIPVDWVDEDDLAADALAPYKVVYITEPNIPAEGLQALVDWVRAGGTLVTVTGAGALDRYNQPAAVLAKATGVREDARERLLVGNVKTLAAAGSGSGSHGDFTAVGVRGQGSYKGHAVSGTFADGSPAVTERAVGKGRSVHFAWMPGMSYYASSTESLDGLPVGFSAAIRNWITSPVQTTGVELPVVVGQPMIETPMLLSDAGAAVTLLNWSGEAVDRLAVQVRVPFKVKSVSAVKAGPLEFAEGPTGTQITLPLNAADIIMLRP